MVVLNENADRNILGRIRKLCLCLYWILTGTVFNSQTERVRTGRVQGLAKAADHLSSYHMTMML